MFGASFIISFGIWPINDMFSMPHLHGACVRSSQERQQCLPRPLRNRHARMPARPAATRPGKGKSPRRIDSRRICGALRQPGAKGLALVLSVSSRRDQRVRVVAAASASPLTHAIASCRRTQERPSMYNLRITSSQAARHKCSTWATHRSSRGCARS